MGTQRAEHPQNVEIVLLLYRVEIIHIVTYLLT